MKLKTSLKSFIFGLTFLLLAFYSQTLSLANPPITGPYVLITEPDWYTGYPSTDVRIRYVVRDPNNEVSHGTIQFDDQTPIVNDRPMGWYETSDLEPGFHTVTVKLVKADGTGFSNVESTTVSSFYVGSIPNPIPTLNFQHKEWDVPNIKLYFQRLNFLENGNYVDIPSSATVSSEDESDGKRVELSWDHNGNDMRFGMKLMPNGEGWMTDKIWIDYGTNDDNSLHEFEGNYFYSLNGEPYTFAGMYPFGEASRYINIENMRIEATISIQDDSSQDDDDSDVIEEDEDVETFPEDPEELGADTNGDNQIDILDYEKLSFNFNRTAESASARVSAFSSNSDTEEDATSCDFNNDSNVDILDYQILANNFPQI